MAFGGLGSDECRTLIKAEVSPDFAVSRDICFVNNSDKRVAFGCICINFTLLFCMPTSHIDLKSVSVVEGVLCRWDLFKDNVSALYFLLKFQVIS